MQATIQKETCLAGVFLRLRPLKDTCTRGLFHVVGPLRWSKAYILLTALRSFRGHLRTQYAKGQVRVDLGSVFELHQGHPRKNMRTLARRKSIEKLRATHPWVDFQDLEIFLMGFDAGDQFRSHKDTELDNGRYQTSSTLS
jgi:hypothetical protein